MTFLPDWIQAVVIILKRFLGPDSILLFASCISPSRGTRHHKLNTTVRNGEHLPSIPDKNTMGRLNSHGPRPLSPPLF